MSLAIIVAKKLLALKSGSSQYVEDTDPEIQTKQKDNDSV